MTVGADRPPFCCLIPVENAAPSVNANCGEWQLAHAYPCLTLDYQVEAAVVQAGVLDHGAHADDRCHRLRVLRHEAHRQERRLCLKHVLGHGAVARFEYV